jgi:SAM-dependent methyltransferase
MRPLYDRRFYDVQSVGSRRSASVVVPLVMRLVAPISVCDVGCGVGTWLGVFREHGVMSALGVDGAHVALEMLQIPHADFVAKDLTLPLKLDRRFDLAVSLEVAEHLPERSAAGFVQSLTGMAPIVLFSAAVPGQGGTGHINEQWQDYWAALFAKEGFIPLDPIRPAIWTDSAVEWYYRQNILLYCRATELSGYPGLAAYGPARMISVLHPRYVAGLNVAKDSCLSEAVKALPTLATRAIKNRVASRSRPART